MSVLLVDEGTPGAVTLTREGKFARGPQYF